MSDLLYIFHNNEEGNLRCETILTHKFNEWVVEHTEDIKPEWHPKFIDYMPTQKNWKNQFFILHGNPLIPEAVTVIKEYKLPI